LSDRLLEELVERGHLDAAAAGVTRAHARSADVSLDVALLDLDLVVEDQLLGVFAELQQLPSVRLSELDSLDPTLATQFPLGFSRSFGICPLRLEGRVLRTLASSPLSEAWVNELRDLFHVQTEQCVAPPHYVDVTRERVYGVPLSECQRGIEARLARRRRLPTIEEMLARLERASNLSQGLLEGIQYAGSLLDFACMLHEKDGVLRVARATSGEPSKPVSPPGHGSVLRGPLLHATYFLGPVPDNECERAFYHALCRPIPKVALLAPLSQAGNRGLFAYMDNGPRAIPARSVAELTMLFSRVGLRDASTRLARGQRAAAAPRDRDAGVTPEQPGDASAQAAPCASAPCSAACDDEERLVLVRLRQGAREANVSLPAFVDRLLGLPEPAKAEPSAALVGEMKNLFERLATDIPTHLARGMESAFRELVPRIAAAPPPAVPAPVTHRAHEPMLGLVHQQAEKKEPKDYASRRAKAPRLKL
jgi:hypothetical protein